MARAMPVISISRPRKTNSGTASRMRWLMPSSMRPTTTTIGRVGRERDVAEGREPEREGDRHAGEHHRADSPTKKISRLRLPSGFSTGLEQDQHADQRRDQRHGAEHVSRQSPTSSSRRTRDDDHQPDADRQRGGAPGVGISSAGVVTKISSAANS